MNSEAIDFYTNYYIPRHQANIDACDKLNGKKHRKSANKSRFFIDHARKQIVRLNNDAK